MISKNSGFSMLEVLIAIAIMGVIAGISVPNYTKMKRSSKKAEAQSSLGQVYISEKAFFLQWRNYTTNLMLIGAIPEGPLTYNVGFAGDRELKSGSGYRGPTMDSSENTHSFSKICGKSFDAPTTGTSSPESGKVEQCAFVYKKQGEYIGFNTPAISKIPTNPTDYTVINTTTGSNIKPRFKAGAIANLVKKYTEEQDPGFSDDTKKHYDIWSIDQHKQVKRECNPCPY